MTQYEHFMWLAIEEANLAFEKGEIPIGAVAVHGGRVIGRGHNSKETERDPTAHAEIVALRQAARERGGWRLLDVTLYSTVEPCPMCAGAMVLARLPHLVYGADDPKAGAAGSVLDLLNHAQLNHHVRVTRGVLGAEAAALLDQFFLGLREGIVPRCSQAWKRRQLAKRENS